jgi:hypothetical protein
MLTHNVEERISSNDIVGMLVPLQKLHRKIANSEYGNDSNDQNKQMKRQTSVLNEPVFKRKSSKDISILEALKRLSLRKLVKSRVVSSQDNDVQPQLDVASQAQEDALQAKDSPNIDPSNVSQDGAEVPHSSFSEASQEEMGIYVSVARWSKPITTEKITIYSYTNANN